MSVREEGVESSTQKIESPEKIFPPKFTCRNLTTGDRGKRSLHGRGDRVGWSGAGELIVEVDTSFHGRGEGVICAVSG